MRVVVAGLLALSACAADHPTRDVSDFCGVPASSCGRHFVDEQGHDHVMSCPPADGGAN